MARFLHHDFPLWWRKGSTVFLASCFASGLAAGCMAFFSAECETASLMRAAADSRVSIVGLLSVIFLPFLFSAFAVYLRQPWWLLPIAFCKAFSFALVFLGITAAYGSAGWLMRLLLMFSDLWTLPLLCYFWLRYATGERRLALRVIPSYLCAVLLIAIIDHCLISPFLANL